MKFKQKETKRRFHKTESYLKSTLSKTDTFGTGCNCLSERDVGLIEG